VGFHDSGGAKILSLLAWLQTLGLERYAPILAENDVDMESVRLLTESDLQALGFSLGHRRKLLAAAAALNAPTPPAPPSGFAAPTAPGLLPADSADMGERRQLTVLFCDMVGFTELANRLDPEELQRIIRAYENACAVCVFRYEGYVFQRLGDGIVAFFGYPLAHEDEAERAIRAGLEIIQSLAILDVGAAGRLEVRIGIATGLVVISATEKAAVGEAMNLASRLQAIARPGSIVVSEPVHRLAGGVFDYEDLGGQTVKGIARPVPAWQVIGLRRAESRFQAAHRSALTQLVGRQAECDLLREAWRQAAAGRGRVVSIVGEAGIGKSRLLRVLIDEARQGSGVWSLELQCSPFHTQSALYPVAEQLRNRIFGEERHLDDAARWEAIAAYLRSTSLDLAEALPLFAHLLSVAPPASQLPSALSPERARLLTRQFLAAILVDLAKTSPGLFILEDLHWADPSTLDLIDYLATSIREAGVLVLLTHRPEFERTLPAAAEVTQLSLQRLRGSDAAAMVRLAFGDQEFPPEVLSKVLEKTDGVPLYIEEFSKAVVESRHAAVTAAAAQVVIPASLHDSLLARLDLLGEAKGVAQLAAMLGREFSREVLAAVWVGSEEALASGLDRLVQAGFVYPADDGARGRYLFKHALIQDAACESLLKSNLAAHHRRIAEVLETRFTDLLTEQPEVIAHHYAAGKLPERAARLWLDAGRQALRRNAHVEAAAHLRSALAAHAELPWTPQRALAELDVQITLGTALVAAKGYASSDVESAWMRAQQLCASVGDVPQQFPALFGMWMFQCVRANHRAALEISENIVRRAEAVQSGDLLIEALLARGISNFFLGDFAPARSNFERIDALYDPALHGAHRFQFGQDPLAIALIYLAWVQWITGDGPASLATIERATVLARGLEHPFTLSFVLAFSGWLRLYRDEVAEAAVLADETIALCTAEDIPVFLAQGLVIAAWCRCERGEPDGAAAMQSALDIFRSTGSRCFLPYWESFQAEAASRQAEPGPAIERLDRALAAMETTQERWAEPEVHRLRGLALERLGHAASDAEACHRKAVAAAQRLGAPGWERRAAAALAACLQSLAV